MPSWLEKQSRKAGDAISGGTRAVSNEAARFPSNSGMSDLNWSGLGDDWQRLQDWGTDPSTLTGAATIGASVVNPFVSLPYLMAAIPGLQRGQPLSMNNFRRMGQFYGTYPKKFGTDMFNMDRGRFQRERRDERNASEAANANALRARQLALAMGLPGGAGVGFETDVTADTLKSFEEQARQRDAALDQSAMQNFGALAQLAVMLARIV